MNEPTSRIVADKSKDTQPEEVPAGFRWVKDLGADGPVRQVLVEQTDTETARLVRLAMARHSERDLVAAARARHGLVHGAAVGQNVPFSPGAVLI